jgi:hypothetical protein
MVKALRFTRQSYFGNESASKFQHVRGNIESS